MLAYMLSLYENLPLSRQDKAQALNKWISLQESRCTDDTFSARFPWRETGLPQHYFLQRKVGTAGRILLTGPRYQGGDINRPFVDVVASNADIDHGAFMDIIEAWKALKPLYVRVLVPPEYAQRGRTDQLVYACALPHHQVEKTDDILKLEPALRADFTWCRGTLLESYHFAWHSLPELRGRLMFTSEEELSQCLMDGSVYLVLNNGVRVGLIICEEENVAFLPGFRITEEAIRPAWRGRGLASKAQKLLCRALDQTTDKRYLLMGTILPENQPSIKTAEKAGRSCLLRYQFLTEDDVKA